MNYRLDSHFIDSSGSAAEYSDEGYSLFSIKAGESKVVQASIKNIPKKKGKYKVKFNICNNKGTVLPTSSGGLQLEREFEVDDDDGNPNNFMSISALQLDVLKIEACTDEGECTVASGPMQLDLLELADGRVDFANKVLLPDNTKELRLVLSENNTITAEGISSALTVPSGSTSGLKLKGQQVFSEKGGFLTGITLDFDLERDLVVQENKSNSNGKGKGKKASSDDDVAVYSFKLKPVIKLGTAQVEALPENMAGVVALPDEDATLTLGDDFSMQIPAGAVSEATIVTTEEIRNYIEVFDPLLQQIVVMPDLSSTFKLEPKGLVFAKPLQLMLKYIAALKDKFTEQDLTIRHDGHKVETRLNAADQVVAGEIEHFSKVIVSSYRGECTEEKVGEELENDAQVKYFDCEAAHGFPRMHVAVIDRVSLADTHELRVIATDSESQDVFFQTEPMEDFTDNFLNKPIVAINGNTFSCKGGGQGCYTLGMRIRS